MKTEKEMNEMLEEFEHLIREHMNATLNANNFPSGGTAEQQRARSRRVWEVGSRIVVELIMDLHHLSVEVVRRSMESGTGKTAAMLEDEVRRHHAEKKKS